MKEIWIWTYDKTCSQWRLRLAFSSEQWPCYVRYGYPTIRALRAYHDISTPKHDHDHDHDHDISTPKQCHYVSMRFVDYENRGLLREFEALLKAAMLSKLFLSFLPVCPFLKGKNLLTQKLKGVWYTEKQKEVTKVISLCKNSRQFPKNIHFS